MLRPAFVLTFLLTLITACGGQSSGGPLPTSDARAALLAIQASLDRSGGYRIQVQGTNLVLPQWGGVNGGTVRVTGDGASAEAKLERTGEPGATYTIDLSKGQTYFQRSTCSETFRIPGGGADVLRPFLLKSTQLLAKGRDVRFENGELRATLDGLGAARIKADAKTSRLQEIRWTANGYDYVWSFDDWGEDPSVHGPNGAVQDRGPGGIPC